MFRNGKGKVVARLPLRTGFGIIVL